ncbi:MAG: hypothetical protein ACI4TK_05135 [Agathobacter sp.]
MKKMTEHEAIVKIKDQKRLCFIEGYIKIQGITEAFDIAIKALEEIQQYRAIGTLEECRAAVDKQNAKKVGEPYINYYGNKKAECLNCHCSVLHPSNYCKFCGQKLDW